MSNPRTPSPGLENVSPGGGMPKSNSMSSASGSVSRSVSFAAPNAIAATRENTRVFTQAPLAVVSPGGGLIFPHAGSEQVSRQASFSSQATSHSTSASFRNASTSLGVSPRLEATMSDSYLAHIYERIADVLSMHDERVTADTIEDTVRCTANAHEALTSIVDGDDAMQRLFFFLVADMETESGDASPTRPRRSVSSPIPEGAPFNNSITAIALQQHSKSNNNNSVAQSAFGTTTVGPRRRSERPIRDNIRIMNTLCHSECVGIAETEVLHLAVVMRGKASAVTDKKETEYASDIHVIHVPQCTGSMVLTLVQNTCNSVLSMHPKERAITNSVGSIHNVSTNDIPELANPPKELLRHITDNIIGHQKAAMDNRLVARLEELALQWLTTIDKLKNITSTPDPRYISEESGPQTELERASTAFVACEALAEQFDSELVRMVCNILTVRQHPIMNDVNEAQHFVRAQAQTLSNVLKYLRSLSKYLDKMDMATPLDQLQSLLFPFMQNVFLIAAANGEDFSVDRLTLLLVTVTNQLIGNCKLSILGPRGNSGRLWEVSEDEAQLEGLLQTLRKCIGVCTSYQGTYHRCRDASNATASHPLNLNELLIFGKLELFCKRLQKLQDVFSAVSQFRTLRTYHLEGFETISGKFFMLTEELRRRCVDLLDYTKPTFDKEYVEFTKGVMELESTVQVHINSSFESNPSTMGALDMLLRFKKIFSTDALRVDLSSKDAVILHNYSVELEYVQKVYEQDKENPPVIRHSPPAVGPILWARHLLYLIEAPMRRLDALGILRKNPREARRVIKAFNTLGDALMQFQFLWYQAWATNVPNIKSALDATLLVQHNGQYICNFDRSLRELIAETRWLHRINASGSGTLEPLPLEAKSLLQQETRIRSSERLVSSMLSFYNETVSLVHPVLKVLIQPCITYVRSLMQPGETTIMWTSLVVSEFVNTVTSEIAALRRVVDRVNEVLENRVQQNIRDVMVVELIDLMEDRTCTVDQFIALQTAHTQHQLALLRTKSREIENAVVEMCAIIRERVESLPTAAATKSASSIVVGATVLGSSVMSGGTVADDSRVLMHFNRLLFKAVLHCASRSFHRLRQRLNGWANVASNALTNHRNQHNQASAQYTPLFESCLELHRPTVFIHPSLNEVQTALNLGITSALGVTKHVGAWECLPESAHFYNEIARNKEVVKVVLMLTGCLHGIQQQVNEYLLTFDRFRNLCSAKPDTDGYAASKAAHQLEGLPENPTLQDYVTAFNANSSIENDLKRVMPRVDIAALRIDTNRLVRTLNMEISHWKQRYAHALHRHADVQLDNLSKRLDALSKRLQQKISGNDLSEVRAVLEAAEDVRQCETMGSMSTTDIEAMYTTIARFDLKVNKEVYERLTEIRQEWNKARALAIERTQDVASIQHMLRIEFMDSVKKFRVDVLVFYNDFVANGPMVSGIRPAEAIERLKRYQRVFADKARRFASLQVGEEMFGLPRKTYPELAKISKELDLLDKLYTLHIEVSQFVSSFVDTFWVSVRLGAIGGRLHELSTSVKALPSVMRSWDAFKELKQNVVELLEMHPVLELLQRPSIKERHWRNVMELCGTTWPLDVDEFKIRHLVEAKLHLHKDDITDLAVASDKENELEAKLRMVESTWKEQIVTCADFKHRGAVVLKGDDIANLKELLEETHLVLGSMLSSRFIGPFRGEVAMWSEKLASISETLDLWMEVQALWIYLEAVFSGGDIMKQLPQEAKRFAMIDKQWHKIMMKANEVRNVMTFCYGNEVLGSLPYLKEQLEALQRQLATYLEQKRGSFSRFYFISDGVLLEILSQSSDPTAIQSYLCTMFDGIHRVTLSGGIEVPPPRRGAAPAANQYAGMSPGAASHAVAEVMRITTLHSLENESVVLRNSVPCLGNVEDWLLVLCSSMRATMKEIVQEIAVEISDLMSTLPRFRELILRFPAQVTLTGLMMLWTSEVTNALQSRPAERREWTRRMANVKDDLLEIARGDIDPALRTNVEALITMQVHNIDVWEQIKRAKDPYSFDFQRQLRAYWSTERSSCIISMTDVTLPYCYEYLGIKERLVMTTLTDRCYITLCQAIAIFMGGAPAGPAGTGKTETVKDLGRTVGNYVVVFNCSDQLDFRSMGKIFKGLAQSGAWGCFDEFNRIDLPVLSVVAQQILGLFTALKQRKTEFMFADNTMCKLFSTTGVFVTMNPGYAGRQELPENLKVMFRSVSMMVPERDAIMKVKLASAGYKSAGPLSKKFMVLYSMCEQQLSDQHHYDFGLRNILSVLRSAGQALRGSNVREEEAVFVRTLQEMNLSKLVHADVELFLALLNDIFPGKALDRSISSTAFQTELLKQISLVGLSAPSGWVAKCAQLNDTRNVRHGYMLVGPSGVGKTTCSSLTTATLSVIERRHKELRMNPKAITAPQMFGRMDSGSGDWYDGIFSFLWRRANKDKTANVWLVCDGPVDTLWIENLNTVLDDNRLLTLANGDRIPMALSVRMCFEVEHLNHASPATVSRVGIIYISEEELPWDVIPKTTLVGAAASALANRAGGGGVAELDMLLDGGSARVSAPGSPGFNASVFSDDFESAGRTSANNNNNANAVDWSNLSGLQHKYQVLLPKAVREEALRLYAAAVPELTTLVTRQTSRVMHVPISHHVSSSLILLADLLESAMKQQQQQLAGQQQGANAGGNPFSLPLRGGSRKRGSNVQPQQLQFGASNTSGSVASLPKSLVEKCFWYAMAWSFGALLETQDRTKFSDFIISKSLISKQALWPQDRSGATIFDYQLVLDTNEWRHWEDVLFENHAEYAADVAKRFGGAAPASVSFSGFYIPTVESLRMAAYLKTHVSRQRAVLVVGSGGSSKTVTIENFLAKTSVENSLTLISNLGTVSTANNVQWRKQNLSSVTTPNSFQASVEDTLEKRMGLNYGPKHGAHLLFFIDDLSSPDLNQWGDQETGELLRQMIDSQGVYALNRIGEWKQFVDLTFVGAMSHPGAGRNDIPNRLKRHFAIVNLPVASDDVLNHIYGTVLRAKYTGGDNSDIAGINLATRITKLSISLWRIVCERLLPTPQKFHYLFDLRDLTRICQGLFLLPTRPQAADEAAASEDDTEAAPYKHWAHECTRVLADKLNDEEDVTWFQKQMGRLLAEIVETERAAKYATTFPLFANFMRDSTMPSMAAPPTTPSKPRQRRSSSIVDVGESPARRRSSAANENSTKVDKSIMVMYEPVRSLALVKDRLMMLLRLHNEAHKNHRMDLVLFDTAVTHVMRIARVLSMPQGSIVLVGVGGSGKQSVTRLAAYVLNYPLFQPSIHSTYTSASFLDDMKAQYILAATRPLCFLLSENDIKSETFLESVNVSLASGDVLGLFSPEDKDSVRTDVRARAKADLGRDFLDTEEVLWNYFIRKVRENLHYVLCFSPAGPKFRERVRKFPSLMSCCTVDWFFPWPEEALMEVATKFIRAIRDTLVVEDTKTCDRLARLFASAHHVSERLCSRYRLREKRHVFSTPKSFLIFLDSFKDIYTQKISRLEASRNVVDVGLQKLYKAEEDITTMKSEITEKEKKLAQAQSETDELLMEITDTTANAQRQKAKISQVKDILAEEADRIDRQRAEAAADLAAAQPALEAARAALDQITQSDMKTLKSILKPPELVRRIFDGVCILLQMAMDPVTVEPVGVSKRLVMNDSWGTSGRPLVSRIDIMEVLNNFNVKLKDNINDETCELIQPYLDQDDFVYDRARSACGNVAGLCTWVRAMQTYHNIAKYVEPKTRALREMESKMRLATAKLKAQQQELELAEQELETCQRRLDQARAKKQELEDDARRTKRRMESAQNLLLALDGEKKRWTNDSKTYKTQINQLVGDVAASAAFITYAGGFNADYRQTLLDEIIEDAKTNHLPMNPSFSLVRFMVSEQQITEWQLQGLPADDHSTQNAIIVTTSPKAPMLIDPQGQGQYWVQKTYAADGLVTTQMNLSDTKSTNAFYDVLRAQMREGKPMLIERMGASIDSSLDNILEKRILRTGRSTTVVINDQPQDYCHTFRLYFSTSHPNPTFQPELFAKSVVVDFTVTSKGLEQQLLSRVVARERADYETQREKLLEDINANDKRLNLLEERLLEKLSKEGNLIDDEGLIEALTETKSASLEIKEQLDVAADTGRRINTARNEYLPVAVRGSVLYFTSVDMSNVNSMYQCSLMSFIRLFDNAVITADGSSILQQRIRNITEKLTWDSFGYLGRGLYEADKKLLVMLLTLKVMMLSSRVTQPQFRYLLQAATTHNADEILARRPNTTWAPLDVWKNVVLLEEVAPAQFRSLSANMMHNEEMWKAFVSSPTPETMPVPDLGVLTPFEHLLLVRCLRSDRTLLAANKLVSSVLGERYHDVPMVDLGAVVEEATPLVPIIYLLSAGADPTSNIESLAKRLKKSVHVVSMGQGQEQEAANARMNINLSGNWVVIQNCHLGISFLENLERQLEREAAGIFEVTDKTNTNTNTNNLTVDATTAADSTTYTVNSEARVWLTTQPTPHFPVTLLQLSITLTNDPPIGLKSAMKRSLGWIPQDLMETFHRGEWRKMLYALCFMHSVVQERGRFGSIGWCTPYGFNHSDWYASMVFIQNHIASLGDEANNGATVKRTVGAVGWDAVRYMVGEIHYGGRITDQRDRFIFSHVVERFFTSHIMDPNYKLCSDLNQFTVPQTTEIRAIRDHANEQIPDVDPPEVLGLHSNVDVTLRLQQVNHILSTITRVQPRSSTEKSGGDGRQGAGPVAGSRDITVRAIAMELSKTVPAPWPQHVIDGIKTQYGAKNSMMIVLAHEAQRLSTLLEAVRDTLRDVQLAVEGTLVMTPALQNAMDMLHDAMIPDCWRALSWESMNLGTWTAELTRRSDQLALWHKKGVLGCYWLYGFFSPQAFLSSVRQTIARAHNWALDRVDPRLEITRIEKTEVNPPAEGVYVTGLYLEGASWETAKSRLREPQPNTIQCELPLVYIGATLNVSAPPGQPGGGGGGGGAAPARAGLYEVRGGNNPSGSNTVRGGGAPTTLGSNNNNNNNNNNNDDLSISNPNALRIPCYRTRARGDANWVTDVDVMLEDKKDAAHWILRGVAIICTKT
eukprot:PhM_4_TR10512/c1_g1_i1/m.53321/K10408/DNAH; dynein heavy chain, axonemal